MQFPKAFIGAFVLGLVLVGAALLVGQLNNLYGKAANGRITGTIVLHDSTTDSFTSGVLTLPGSSCDVIIKQCSNTTFYRANGYPPLSPVNNWQHFIISALYTPPETENICFPSDAPCENGAPFSPPIAKLLEKIDSAFGINASTSSPGTPIGNPFCNGTIYKDLDVTTDNVFIVGKALYTSGNFAEGVRKYITNPSYPTNTDILAEDITTPILTSLTVTYSCT